MVPQTAQTRQPGSSDLQITPMGFGAWAVSGGDWAWGWGDQENDEFTDTYTRDNVSRVTAIKLWLSSLQEML
jgi:hypothetical protein